jgi:hypothetical protein
LRRLVYGADRNQILEENAEHREVPRRVGGGAMTLVEFFTGSGVIAWGVVAWMTWRAIRVALERLRSFQRRLSWALSGWARPRMRYY